MLYRHQYRCGLPIFLLLFPLLLFGGTALSSAQEDSNTWRERFLSEAPAAWQRHRQEVLYVTGSSDGSYRKESAEGTSIININTSTLSRSTRSLRSWGKVLRAEEGSGLQEGEETVIGVNPQYAFEIRRQHGGDWLIHLVQPRTNLDLTVEGGAPLGQIEHFVVAAFNHPDLLGMAPALTVEDWFNDDTFQVYSVEPVPNSNPVLVEVQCRITRQEYGVANATWILAPHQNWTLRSYRATLGDPVQSTWSFEVKVEDEDSPIAIPTSAITTIDASLHTLVLEIASIQRVHRQFAPDREFYLSAFGLPEPDWARRGIPWYWYLSLAAIALVILGALVIRILGVYRSR